MFQKTDFADTPCYVLKSGNLPIFPKVVGDDPDADCVCVYGFSNKLVYDQFIKNAAQPLTPYPLVNGYLANQIAVIGSDDTNGAGLRLVILDATDPAQPVLTAATMAAVLLAQQEKAKQIPVEFELVYDPETNSYRLNNGF